MLQHTFRHLAGIGPKRERDLWRAGIHTWEDALNGADLGFSPQWVHSMRAQLRESTARLDAADAQYFSRQLPASEHWRLFPSFRESVAYVDIETTGLGDPGDYVTTIALYDGRQVFTYVHDQNLTDFCHDIRRYKLLVTYNGKSFDVPFLRNYLGVKLEQAHIDLRHVLGSLGYRGGLKGCEKALGLDRQELDGVDGFFAVLLWWDYLREGNPEALNTLLAYNVLDVINLERLMTIAFNLKLADTPFEQTHRLPETPPPPNPFTPHPPTLARLRKQLGPGALFRG